MSYELNEIKEVRKKLGLTQGQLAKRASVSQSLIAKIESNRIDPTYTKVQKIFEALDSLSKKNDLKADELMTSKIISVSSNDSVKNVIAKMKKYEISQMPVIDDGNAVGIISESVIINRMVESENPVELVASLVKDLMYDCPPVISKKASSKVVSGLLRFYPILLVSENGKLAGLITKADLLRKIC